MAVREVALKKYVVRLSVDERAQLDDFVHEGKRSAALLTKARFLLKADVSEAGEGWSDSRIVEALNTSSANVFRTRQRLVEDGFEAVLTRNYNANSAPPRLFDGEAEARLIALACSQPPEVTPDGACACLRTKSSNSASWRAPATTPSGGRSKTFSSRM